MSVRLRLTLWYSTILAVTLLIFGVILYFVMSYFLYADQKSQMENLAKDIYRQTSGIQYDFLGKSTYLIRTPALNDFRYANYFVQLIDAGEGKVQQAIPRELPIPVDQFLTINLPLEGTYTNELVYGTRLLMFHLPLYIGNQEQLIAIIQVAAIDTIFNILNTLRYMLIFLAVITVLLAGTIGWFMARKALRPIETVIMAANQIQHNLNLEQRIIYDGPADEIGRLTNTINSMLSRIQFAYNELEESYRAQRRFVSDASHELRTPLTTIRGNVDWLQKLWENMQHNDFEYTKEQEQSTLEALQDISDEAKRMSRLINDLLSLARADAGYVLKKELVELAPLVESVARRAQFLPKTAMWKVGDITALDEQYVLGDADHLQQLLFIFIDNAFKYTKTGTVQLDAIRMEDQIGIRIQDEGIGMNKEVIPHVFDRFFRADPSRGEESGTGLGLSIAKWIIDEHGGSIELLSEVGQGSTFIVWLPASSFNSPRNDVYLNTDSN